MFAIPNNQSSLLDSHVAVGSTQAGRFLARICGSVPDQQLGRPATEGAYATRRNANSNY
jgi:hypothetical protein